MNIQTNYNLHFGSSQLNILSMADNHGDILGLPQVIKTVQENSNSIFEKKKEPSTQNVFAIVGDYFMNPGGTGIVTHKDKTFGDIQFEFLNKLIHEIKRNFSSNQKIDAIYTPGNHCFGAGDDWLFDRLFNAEMTTIITNVNLKKSPIIEKFTKKTDNIMAEKIYTIPDSKNPNVQSHVLFLGVTIPSMYYNFNNIKHTAFYDQTTKNDAAMSKHDFKTTIKLLRRKIGAFKEKYPNGSVVLMSHTGNKISNIFAENVEGIDLILNAHDHKDYTSLVGKTQILSHGQNNKFIRNISMLFDDNGKLKSIKSQKFETSPYIKAARKDSYLQSFVKKLLKKDLKPLVCFDKSNVKTEDLLFNNEIRYSNTLLANCITTALAKEARKVYPKLTSVGIPSTIIRNGLLSNNLRTTFNNIDLLNMFKGVDTNVSGLRIGTISGVELLKLIVENVGNNLVSPTRNALIQWSDIQINRKLFERSMKSPLANNFYKLIKVRNQVTGEFETIKPSKQYTIILADKYLIKDTKNVTVPKQILPKFQRIKETYRLLFKRYLESLDGRFAMPEEVNERRII